MDYIYMDNFRGFSQTLFPVRRTNFLVGENSTGKSSVLALLKIIQDGSFDFDPSMVLQRELGGYKDIVSAGSEDKSYFRIGFASIKSDKQGKYSLTGNIYQFGDNQGSPSLNYYMQEKHGLRFSLVFTKTKVKYRGDAFEGTYDSEQLALSQYMQMARCQEKDSNYVYLPGNKSWRQPLFTYIFRISDKLLKKKNKNMLDKFRHELVIDTEINGGSPISSLDPIRSKPQKIYEGSKHSYSADGSHTYFELNRIAKSRGDKSSKQLKSINAFGKYSGLFDSITTHSFGRGLQSPFEVLVKYSDVPLNLTNVGYGVSQILPLLIECLNSGESMQFEIQQPEVHLHPRAQAAFGDFLYQLMAEGSHTIFVETHSDYLIDRYRLAMNKEFQSNEESQSPSCQILFFEKEGAFNKLTEMIIEDTGAYPEDQPDAFREFFINEAIELLEI